MSVAKAAAEAVAAAGGYILGDFETLVSRITLETSVYEEELKEILENPQGFTVSQVLTFLKLHVHEEKAEPWEVAIEAAAKAEDAAHRAQRSAKKCEEYLERNPREVAKYEGRVGKLKDAAAAAEAAAAEAAAAEAAAVAAAGPAVAAGLVPESERTTLQSEQARALFSVMREQLSLVMEEAKAIAAEHSHNLNKPEEYQSW